MTKLLSDEDKAIMIGFLYGIQSDFLPADEVRHRMKAFRTTKGYKEAIELLKTQKHLYAEIAISLDAEALMRVGNKSDNHRSHVPAYKAIIEEQMARIK